MDATEKKLEEIKALTVVKESFEEELVKLSRIESVTSVRLTTGIDRATFTVSKEASDEIIAAIRKDFETRRERILNQVKILIEPKDDVTV